MRLVHYGTFDVKNYGDLLFPLIVEQRLGDMFTDIVHVSPLGGSVYDDVRASVSVRHGRRLTCDAVVIGGGNILHASRTTLPAYARVRFSAYPSLWMEASMQALKNQAPLVVNSPGVAGTFRWPADRALRSVTRQAGYASVRDEPSLERVERAGSSGVRVVPDTALQLADVLPYTTDSFAGLPGSLSTLKEGEYVVVHVNSRYSSSDISTLAATIDALSRALDTRICLVAIGPCHGDDVVAAELGEHMTSDPVVYSDPGTVTSVAHLIAGSKLYIGSSLHGFITAASYGVPGLLVADDSQQSKFRGLLERIGGTSRMLDSWETAVSLLADTTSKFSPAFEPADISSALTEIDEHWTLVREALSQLDSRDDPGARRRLRWRLRATILKNAAVFHGKRIVRGLTFRSKRSP